jgi:hypothetical protein
LEHLLLETKLEELLLVSVADNLDLIKLPASERFQDRLLMMFDQLHRQLGLGRRLLCWRPNLQSLCSQFIDQCQDLRMAFAEKGSGADVLAILLGELAQSASILHWDRKRSALSSLTTCDHPSLMQLASGATAVWISAAALQ